MVMWSPLVLITHPALPVNSVKELIALSKTRDMHYASAGNGTGGHMCGELFKSLTGARAVHVPYKGAALGTNDVVSGAVQFAFVGPITAVGLTKAGKLKMLAVTSSKRNPAFPDLPSVDEQTGSGYDVVNWFGIAAPPKLPKAMVAKLNAEIASALQSPEVRKRLGGDGSEIIGNTPEYFADFIKRDLEKWKSVVAKAGMTLD
jgi:tripartite-type tricarboxylate transporter receptor subunit TctC